MHIIRLLGKRLRIPNAYNDFAIMVCEFHLHIHNIVELDAKMILHILEKTHALRKKEDLQNLLKICAADALNRTQYKAQQYWMEAYQVCANIFPDQVMSKGFSGTAITREIRNLRLSAITNLITQWKLNERK